MEKRGGKGNDSNKGSCHMLGGEGNLGKKGNGGRGEEMIEQGKGLVFCSLLNIHCYCWKYEQNLLLVINVKIYYIGISYFFYMNTISYI